MKEYKIENKEIKNSVFFGNTDTLYLPPKGESFTV